MMNFYEIKKKNSSTEFTIDKKSDMHKSNGDETNDDAISMKSDDNDGMTKIECSIMIATIFFQTKYQFLSFPIST